MLQSRSVLRDSAAVCDGLVGPWGDLLLKSRGPCPPQRGGPQRLWTALLCPSPPPEQQDQSCSCPALPRERARAWTSAWC